MLARPKMGTLKCPLILEKKEQCVIDIDLTLTKDPGCRDINCVFVIYASQTRKRIGQDINISLVIERDTGAPMLMSEEQLLQAA